MAQYEAVPRHETVAEDTPIDPSKYGREASQIKESAQIYVQVPNDDSEGSQRSNQYVQKRCIHPIVLIGLALLFAACALTVGLLFHFSRVNDGLTTELESRRYAWIYGPTAVVVLLRVIWRVIDLNVQGSMPWHELATGINTASKTVTLEYMSRTIFGNLFQSIKHGHWAVTTTILGNLVLLLMIVFATGLFALENTRVTQQGVRFVQNGFNGSAYNSSLVQASPALLNLAIQSRNLSYPQGTTRDTLVPLFKPLEKFPEDSTYEADVVGLGVSVDCEILDIVNATKTYLPWWSLRAPYFLSNISTSGCELINVPVGMGTNGMVRTMNNTQTYSATMDNYVCNSGVDYSTPESKGNDLAGQLDLTTYYKSLNRTLDNRIFVSLVDFHFPPNHQSEIPGMWIHNMTSMLCKPSYSVNRYHVTYHQNSTNATIQLIEKTDRQMPGYYPGDISRGVDNIFDDYENMYLGMGGSDFVLSEPVPPFFQIIENLHGGEKAGFTLKNLMDPDLLKSSAESLVAGTAIQQLHMNIMTEFLEPTAETGLEGTAKYFESRLQVKVISTGFLCGCFAIMTILTIVLLFTAPRHRLVQASLGSTVIVSDALQSNLPLAATFADHDVTNSKAAVSSWLFFSSINPNSGSTTIELFPTGPDVPRNRTVKPIKWWRPASARTWFTAVAATLAIVIIGVLEGIQQISDRNNGFVSLRSLDLGTTVLAQYVPAAVAVGINLVFGSIELVVAGLTPFAALKKGNVTRSRSLALDYLTKSGPHTFFQSLVNRHLALTVILLTTFVASFLSIVIPGLYTHHNLPSISNPTVLQMDKFDPSGVDISFDDRGAATMLDLLTYYDIEYPQWVHDDLALPQFASPSLATDEGDEMTSTAVISLQTQAIRARLQCESVTSRTEWMSYPYSHAGLDRDYSEWVAVNSTIELPWSLCSNPPRNVSSASTVKWVQTFLSHNDTMSGDYMRVGRGNILKWDEALSKSYHDELTIGGDGTKESNSGSGLNPTYITLADWGCPSLAFTVGTISFKSDPRNAKFNFTNPYDESRMWNKLLVDADVSTIVCAQHVQSVQTNVTFDYPGMILSTEKPPQPDESTVQWLKNMTAAKDGTTFHFAPNSMLLSLNNPNGSLSAPFSQTDDVDRYTQALAYIADKEDNMTFQDLVSKDNTGSLQKVAQKLYGRYMAQAFSNNMRVDVSKETLNITLTDAPWSPPTSKRSSSALSWRRDATQPSIPAILTQTGAGGHTRMVQNRGPKIALQVMLGFMAAGAIISKLLLSTKELLPHVPYSIAGRAVLVANGNILNHDTVSKDKDQKEQRYRLGWWKDNTGTEKYGVCIQE